MIARLWHWLTTSNDDSWRRLDRAWLADTSRLAEYEAFTYRENMSCVTKDSAWFQRRAFWASRDKTESQRKLKVVNGRF